MGKEMIIDEEDCKEKILSLTNKSWKPLLDLIPEIENTRNFGEWEKGEKDEEGVIQFPYFIPADVVSQFLKIVYSIPIIISFNWGAWNEGRKIANTPNFNFDNANLVTKCKLITALVRNDRFCDGALASAFESGLILKILKSIENQVNTLT